MLHKLNKYHPFAIVYGDPKIRYEQYGKYFDRQENEIQDKPDTTLHIKKKNGLETK